MARKLPFGPLAAAFCLTMSVPSLAAQPSAAKSPVDAPAAADVCRNDLRTFDTQMEKDGAGYGMYGGDANQDRPAFAGPAFHNARPGYEVRVLIDAANIMARHGQQGPCEDVLIVTRGLYQRFLVEMQNGKAPKADMPAWRERQIRAAVSVAGSNVAFRSDELLGVEVRSPANVALGSVDDLVLSPDTSKIGYLVIARGGIFGFDESRVPIPWDDFKATPNASLLVLDTTKSVLDGAPQVKKNVFSVNGDVDSDSHKVDEYWKAHQPLKASN